MPANSSTGRPMVRGQLEIRNEVHWPFPAEAPPFITALTTSCSTLLALWQFSGPDDDRIAPFVSAVAEREGRTFGINPGSVEAMVRVLLGGDQDPLYALPPEQLPLLQVLIARAIIAENELTPEQVDVLLDQAEEQLAQLVLDQVPPRSNHQQIPNAPSVDEPAVDRPTIRTAALWSGLAAGVAVLAILLTGLVALGIGIYLAIALLYPDKF